MIEHSTAETRLSARAHHAHILLVDDNPINQEVACELLCNVGLRVDLAADGAIAVARARQTPYDLILMDIQMPVLDGLAATRQLRAAGYTRPILAMTANVYGEDRQRCIDAGMNDHVGKPVDPDDLYSKLLKWLPDPTVAAPPPLTATAPAVDEDARRLAALRNISLIDCSIGLHAIRNRVPSYLRLLVSFLDSHGHDDTLLAERYHAGQHEETRQLAHNLKGVAGTLGLTAIAQAASQLNDAMHNPGDDEQIARLVATLSHDIADTCTALRTALNLDQDTR